MSKTEKPAKPKAWKLPGSGPEAIVGRDGDVLFIRTVKETLARVDVGQSPPRIDNCAIDYPQAVIRLDERRWVVVARNKSQRPWRFPPTITTNPLIPGREAAPKWSGRAIDDVCVIDGELFGHDADASPPRLLRWEGDTFTEVEGVPPAKGKKDEFTFGTARTGDGSDVLIWDGDGYERTGTTFEKTFPLGAESGNEWSAVPAGPDAFHYTSKRRLFLARRGQKPKGVATAVTGIMNIGRGPTGSLLFKFGNNKKKWAVGALRDGVVTGVAAKAFVKSDDVIVGCAWSDAVGSAFVFAMDAGAIAVLPATLGL